MLTFGSCTPRAEAHATATPGRTTPAITRLARMLQRAGRLVCGCTPGLTSGHGAQMEELERGPRTLASQCSGFLYSTRPTVLPLHAPVSRARPDRSRSTTIAR